MFTHPLPIQPCADPLELEVRLQSLPERVDVLCFEGNQHDIVDRSNMAKTYEFFFGGPMLPASAADCAAKIPADRVRPAQGDALA